MVFKPTEKKLLVIGDLILDKYISGAASKLSPEAPVPVISVTEAPEYRLGGAANVAANIKALGGTPVLIGRINNGGESKELTNLIHEATIDGYFVHTATPLPVKTRIIANHQQVARLDSEGTDPLTHVEEQLSINYLHSAAYEACGIVVSDYSKGMLTMRVIQAIENVAAECCIPVFLDPKISAGKETPLRFPTLITPNLHEAEEIAKIKITDGVMTLHAAATAIAEKYGAQIVLITRGDKGMSLLVRGILTSFPTATRDVYDVSGAGDTVIAAMALALVTGYTTESAVHIANHAAGIVVGKRGTATVTLKELNKELEDANAR